MASDTTFDHWKVVFSWGKKWEKVDFLKTPSMPDFELLDCQSTHHHLPISKKIHQETFFLSQSMFLPLVILWWFLGNLKSAKQLYFTNIRYMRCVEKQQTLQILIPNIKIWHIHIHIEDFTSTAAILCCQFIAFFAIAFSWNWILENMF